MSKTVILVPSRGRVGRLEKMINSANSLASRKIDILVGIDQDDPMCDGYFRLGSKIGNVSMFCGPRNSLSGWTNDLAKTAIESYGTDDVYLVSMGDDHKVKSSAWDIKLINAINRLSGPGFSYGDDLMNGSGLCTAWMASAQVVEELGWMMLPPCNHMYVDNVIMELGQATNRLAYVQSVIIEHLHPVMEKAKIDETYVQGSMNIGNDLHAFNNWRNSSQFEKDASKLNGLRWPEAAQ